MENSLEAPQKTKCRPTIWSSKSTSGYLPKENVDTNSKGYMYLMFVNSINYNSQDMENTKGSIDWWMNKLAISIHRYVYNYRLSVYISIYNGILLSHKKEGNFVIHGNVDGL